jgi:hypothetical protein
MWVMLKILGSSVGALFAAKRSHFAILVICLALIFRGASNTELLKALEMVCGTAHKTGPQESKPEMCRSSRKGRRSA